MQSKYLSCIVLGLILSDPTEPTRAPPLPTQPVVKRVLRSVLIGGPRRWYPNRIREILRVPIFPRKQ